MPLCCTIPFTGHHGVLLLARVTVTHRPRPTTRAEAMTGGLKRFFLIEERQTTIATEIRAGIVTFLTMSYILVVNPQILSQVRRGFGGCSLDVSSRDSKSCSLLPRPRPGP
jgi:hypothetical protein